ncbi:unnamed protein product [Meloidogyne enterolobii]|uniref:Uncharacterized protein n=2 Tax=Meloidogyne enterolobii TaxID=390850 RepID=A0ACB0Z1I1_MELEN
MEFIYFKIFLTKIIFFVLINLTLEQKEINNISTPSPPPFNTLNSLQLISKNLSQCHILLEKIPEELKEYNKQLEYALKLANNISSEVGEVLLINEEKELPGQLQDHHREWTINGDIEIENEPEILKGNNDGIKILKNNFFELNKTELLTLENIDKYLERQLRQAKNKYIKIFEINN